MAQSHTQKLHANYLMLQFLLLSPLMSFPSRFVREFSSHHGWMNSFWKVELWMKLHISNDYEKLLKLGAELGDGKREVQLKLFTQNLIFSWKEEKEKEKIFTDVNPKQEIFLLNFSALGAAQ